MTPEPLSAVLRERARIKIQLTAAQAGAIFRVIEAVVDALIPGNTVSFFDSSGSAADAQHLTTDWEAGARIILASGTTLEPC